MCFPENIRREAMEMAHFACVWCRRRRHAAMRFAGAVVGGLLMVALACEAPRPYSALPPGERATALARELVAVLTSDPTRSHVSKVQLEEVRTTLGQVMDTTRPYFHPTPEYLRALAQRYYPEVLADSERPAAIALVFDARDSLVQHAVGVPRSTDKSCYGVVKRLLPELAETRFDSGGCSNLERHGRRNVGVFWVKVKAE
jgi:hypothetical protein